MLAIMGHMSVAMLERYSHVGMDAKHAVESLSTAPISFGFVNDVPHTVHSDAVRLGASYNQYGQRQSSLKLPLVQAIQRKVGASVRALRKEKGWSQDLFADKTDLIARMFARLSAARAPRIKLRHHAGEVKDKVTRARQNLVAPCAIIASILTAW